MPGHLIQRILKSRFLSYVTSCEAANNIYEALLSGWELVHK